MSAPATSRKSPTTAGKKTAAHDAEGTRVIKAGRVVTDTEAPENTPAPAAKSTAAKTAKTAKSKTKVKAVANGSATSKDSAKADRAERKAELSARLQRAEEDLAREESKTGFGSKTTWVIAAVLGVLVFQMVHSAEHVAQATYWLFNPTGAPWMSPWAMGLVNGLATISGGTPALGMELLHLIGNGIFLAGLLLAVRLPERYKNPEMLRWLRLATIVQTLHFAEHVLLTASVAVSGRAIGVSTMFGLLTPGTPAANGYRVLFHLTINVVALVFAVKAVLAVRDERLASSGRTPTGVDWKRSAFMFAPVVGLLFLLPIFGGSVVHPATGNDVTVASVNGVQITNGELQTEVDAISNQQAALALDPATAEATGVDAQGLQNLDDEQLQYTVLNSLVQAELIQQGADRLGITLTDADVQARKTQLIEEGFLGQANFNKFLADNNVSEEYADEQIRKLAMEEAVQQQLTAGFVADPNLVSTVYAEQYQGLPRARHLLTSSRDLAAVFLGQVEAGQDFDSLIRANSDDPRAASTGGYMGTVAEGAQVPEVVEAISGMQDGEYSIVQSQFGWHVIQRLSPASLVDVEQEIRDNQLLIAMGEAGQQWIGELRASASVVLTDGFGAWDTQFGAVVAPAEDATAAPAAVHEQHG